jgi:hypothetical protein
MSGYELRGHVEIPNPWIQQPSDGGTMTAKATVAGVGCVGHEIEMVLEPESGGSHNAGTSTVDESGRWGFAGDEAMTVGEVVITATDVSEPMTSPHVITVTVVEEPEPPE